jgi:hypothetical protein
MLLLLLWRRDLISSADTILNMANTCDKVVANIAAVQVGRRRAGPSGRLNALGVQYMMGPGGVEGVKS